MDAFHARLEVYVREEGRYVLLPGAGGWQASRVLPELRVRVERLGSIPPPGLIEALEEPGLLG